MKFFTSLEKWPFSRLLVGRLTLQVTVGVCLGFTFCLKLSTCEVRFWINANIRPKFTLLFSSVVVTCDCHWMDTKVSFEISSEDMGTQPWPLPFKLILVHKLIPTRRYWWPKTRSSLREWRGNRKAQTTTTSELNRVSVTVYVEDLDLCVYLVSRLDHSVVLIPPTQLLGLWFCMGMEHATSLMAFWNVPSHWASCTRGHNPRGGASKLRMIPHNHDTTHRAEEALQDQGYYYCMDVRIPIPGYPCVCSIWGSYGSGGSGGMLRDRKLKAWYKE